MVKPPARHLPPPIRWPGGVAPGIGTGSNNSVQAKPATSRSGPVLRPAGPPEPAWGSAGGCACHGGRHSVVQRMEGHGFAPGGWDSAKNVKDGFKTNALVAFQAADGEYVELGTASNYTPDHAHAEDNAMRILNENLGMFGEGRTEVFIYITSSPCTGVSRGGLPATGQGCAERLADYFGPGSIFHLTLMCRGLYSPLMAGYTQAQVLDASRAAVDFLRGQGIDVVGDERPRPQARRFEV